MPSTVSTVTILLVEDDHLISNLESKLLTKFGYVVIHAPSGEEAIERIKGNPQIGLVLMDIDLGPGMDGTEAAVQILKLRDLPLVFLSSHTEPEVVEKTEGITSYGYIVKDSGNTVLQASIKMALRLYASRIQEHQKEEELQKREEYLNAILQTTRDGFWVVDMNGKMIDVNIAYCKLSGFERDEFLDLHISDVDALEEKSDTHERIERIVKNGFERFNTVHKKKDGSLFRVEVSVTFLNLYGGRMVCFCRELLTDDLI